MDVNVHFTGGAGFRRCCELPEKVNINRGIGALSSDGAFVIHNLSGMTRNYQGRAERHREKKLKAEKEGI